MDQFFQVDAPYNPKNVEFWNGKHQRDGIMDALYFARGFIL